MKYLLLLLLAGCAPLAPTPPPPISEPITSQQVHQIFDGHPPVEVLDLEATPDSIATVVAEYYYIRTKHPTKWMRLLSKFH
jgi:hypothetical protein